MLKKKLMVMLLIISMLITFIPSMAFAGDNGGTANAELTPAMIVTGVINGDKNIQLTCKTVNFQGGKQIYTVYAKDVTKKGFVKEGSEKKFCKSANKSLTSLYAAICLKKIGKKKTAVKKLSKKLIEVIVTTTVEGKTIYSKPIVVATRNLGKKKESNAIALNNVRPQINPLYTGEKNKETDFTGGKIKAVYANKKGKASTKIPELRYLSSNPNVATVKTVSVAGKKKVEIEGKTEGTATIYTYTTNGFWKSTAVTVENKKITYMQNPGKKNLVVKGKMQPTLIDDENAQISACYFVCPGYRFKEWNTMENPNFKAKVGTPERGRIFKAGKLHDTEPQTEGDGGNSNNNNSNEELMKEKMTLYAQWEPDPKGVELEVRYYTPNIKNPNKNDIKIYYVRAIVESVVDINAADGTDEVADEIKANCPVGTTIDKSKTPKNTIKQEDNLIKIYCNRTPYTVTYNLGDGVEMSGKPAPASYKCGESVEVPNETPSKVDPGDKRNVFREWKATYKNAEGITKTVKITSDNKFEMPAGDVELEPTWDREKADFIVTIRDFYSAGKDKVYQLTQDSKLTEEQMTPPEITGYTLDKIYKDADYQDEWKQSTDTVTSNTTLYANWEKNSHDVEYIKNEGETYDAPETASKSYGDTVQITEIIPEKTGAYSKFAGWSGTFAKGSEEPKKLNINADNTFTMPDGEVKIEAKWTKQPDCRVFLRDFYPTGSDKNYTVEYSSKLNDSQLKTPEVTGYSFDGWYKDETFNEEWDKNEDSVKKDTELYANWKKDSYTVTYNKESDEDFTVPDIETVDYGERVSIENITPEKEGRNSKFIGWKAEYEASSDTTRTLGIASDNTFKMPAGNVKLSAMWDNQPDCTVMIRTFWPSEYDKIYKVPYASTLTNKQLEAPEVAGYEFKGWFKDSNYETEWKQDSDKVTKTTDIYGKWEQTSYTINYDQKTGENYTKPAEDSKHKGDKVSLIEETPTKTEGTDTVFLGWKATYENANGDKVTMGISSDNTFDMPCGNVTIEAEWGSVYELGYHTVMLKNYLPTGRDRIYQVKNNTSVTAEQLETPEIEGYEFVGWYKDAGCTDEWNQSEDLITDKTNIYGKWKKNTYEVTYDKKDGETYTPGETVEATKGEKVSLLDMVPTKTGLNSKFVGWKASYETDGATHTLGVLADNSIIMPAANVKIEAEWRNQDDCTVYFHDVRYNGGDMMVRVPYDGKIVPPKTYDDGEGKSLGEWYKDKECSDGQEWDFEAVVTKDMHLYGGWGPSSSTVNLDANEGTIPDGASPIQIGFDSASMGTLVSATRRGYDFIGWYNAAEDGSLVADTDGNFGDRTVAGYVRNGRWSSNREKILYAGWKAQKYTITYKDQNGATFSGTLADGSPTEHTYDIVTELKDPSKTGYTFNGWFTNSACTGDPVTVLTKDGYIANITLYAKWTANKYKVNLNGNSGTSSVASINVTYDAASFGTAVTANRTGYNFNGWYDAASGGNKIADASGNFANATVSGYITSGKWKSTAEKTLYAQWTEKTATLTYANGGRGTAPSSTTMKYTTATNAAGAISATGYNFTGWKRSDTGAVIAAGAQVKAANVVPSNITLTAQWSEKTATLSYNANGHGTAPSSTTMKYTAKATAAAAISASGWTFQGWNTKSDGKGTSYAAGAEVKAANVVPSNITLYAQWKQAGFEIELNGITVCISDFNWTWNPSDFGKPDQTMLRLKIVFDGNAEVDFALRPGMSLLSAVVQRMGNVDWSHVTSIRFWKFTKIIT